MILIGENVGRSRKVRNNSGRQQSYFGNHTLNQSAVEKIAAVTIFLTGSSKQDGVGPVDNRPSTN